jgi:hypothetical protein
MFRIYKMKYNCHAVVPEESLGSVTHTHRKFISLP